MIRRLLLPLSLGLVALPASAATVVLDTGHSPKRAGVVSAYGRPEYRFNAQVAHYVAERLKARGVKVIRKEGENSLTERTKGTAGADLFISVHHDSIQQSWIDAGKAGQYSGYAMLVSKKNPHFSKSLRCASSIGSHFNRVGEKPSLYHATPIKGENRPLLDKANGVHLYQDLVVLKTSKAPAVLVEVGVIVNPNEDRRLGDYRVAYKLGYAIADGAIACLSK